VEKVETNDKNLIYKELVGEQSPEAIFILSGGTVKRQRGVTTAAYSDLQEEFGVLGGKARIIAAAELAKIFPDTKLVMTGSYYPNPGDPSQSSIMSQELKKLGVEDTQIVTEEFALTSYDELSRIVELSLTHNWQNIAVLTNKYHIPRASLMLRKLDELARKKGDDKLVAHFQEFSQKTSFTFVSAEDVLTNKSSHYANLIKDLEDSPDYQKRIESEKRGVEALESGTYGKSK